MFIYLTTNTLIIVICEIFRDFVSIISICELQVFFGKTMNIIITFIITVKEAKITYIFFARFSEILLVIFSIYD